MMKWMFDHSYADDKWHKSRVKSASKENHCSFRISVLFGAVFSHDFSCMFLFYLFMLKNIVDNIKKKKKKLANGSNCVTSFHYSIEGKKRKTDSFVAQIETNFLYMYRG